MNLFCNTHNIVFVIAGDKVEVIDQRVSVCRDHANGICRRQQCKYYHIPVVIPPANVMASSATAPLPPRTTSDTTSGVDYSVSVVEPLNNMLPLVVKTSPPTTNHNNTTNNNYNNHSNVITTGCLTSTTPITTTTTTASSTTTATNNPNQMAAVISNSNNDDDHLIRQSCSTTTNHPLLLNNSSSQITPNPTASVTSSSFSSAALDIAQLNMWHVLSQNM